VVNRENLIAVILHLQATRQNLIDQLAREGGSEKARQEVRKPLATIDTELPRLSDETDAA
jgi:hypothetical protein